MQAAHNTRKQFFLQKHVSVSTTCLHERALKCVHSSHHLYACVCETEILPASWTSPLSSSCIIPPRVQDSTLSLRVTHGEAAPCPWRTAGITALSLSVTPALSPVMPPRWQAGGVCDKWWQTDRWQVKPARQWVPQTHKPSYIPQSGSIRVQKWMCACIQTHTAALFNTSGMGLQGPVGVEMTAFQQTCVTS